jgi:hypothetical protein
VNIDSIKVGTRYLSPKVSQTRTPDRGGTLTVTKYADGSETRVWTKGVRHG